MTRSMSSGRSAAGPSSTLGKQTSDTFMSVAGQVIGNRRRDLPDVNTACRQTPYAAKKSALAPLDPAGLAQPGREEHVGLPAVFDRQLRGERVGSCDQARRGYLNDVALVRQVIQIDLQVPAFVHGVAKESAGEQRSLYHVGALALVVLDYNTKASPDAA